MEIFEHSLYKDPITERDNFFSFIQSDFQKIFGENGSVIIIDIANFLNFNNKYGKSNGDLCLKCLSDSIYKVMGDNKDAAVFRTHGDEFTLIIRNSTKSYTENICDLIKKEYKKVLSSIGFNDLMLHTLILHYDSRINSIEEYYELLVKKSLDQSEKTGDKFSGERLLKHIIGSIIERVRDTLSYYNNAYNIALVDDVSGLGNHRAGKMFLNNLLEEYKNNNSEFSVLFIDGDNLKRYNELSYEDGNKMIRKLGSIIMSSVRNEDKVYRWLSGDEFLVILKDTNEINSVKSANRIREAVENGTKDMQYPTTISIGLSCCPYDGLDAEEIVNKAEKANALAKSLGKNKVIRWNKDIK
ncbi:MAG: diguanylate cyclase [Bacillota bacterium]|nr:diguanylate cyclase [Bacillota bacterium]